MGRLLRLTVVYQDTPCQLALSLQSYKQMLGKRF